MQSSKLTIYESSDDEIDAIADKTLLKMKDHKPCALEKAHLEICKIILERVPTYSKEQDPFACLTLGLQQRTRNKNL